MKISSESIIKFIQNRVVKTRIRRTHIPYKIDNYNRKYRTKKQISLLKRLKNIINVPEIIWTKKHSFCMEYIKGSFYCNPTIIKKIIRSVNILHNNNILHNDLNSDNIIVDSNQSVWIIDFGLSEVKNKISDFDRVVDILNLLSSIPKEFKSEFQNNYNNSVNFEYYTQKDKILNLRRYV
jgi:Kae1-associated kinase Bud32